MFRSFAYRMVMPFSVSISYHFTMSVAVVRGIVWAQTHTLGSTLKSYVAANGRCLFSRVMPSGILWMRWIRSPPSFVFYSNAKRTTMRQTWQMCLIYKINAALLEEHRVGDTYNSLRFGLRCVCVCYILRLCYSIYWILPSKCVHWSPSLSSSLHCAHTNWWFLLDATYNFIAWSVQCWWWIFAMVGTDKSQFHAVSE